ncbi:synaptotagmin-5-like [Schistocerca serialis cubense]|uniref:synaptotagmin-5-like n=1 Tax=Schistocerca serialis cubense TaxID=2023355 RepID=UPI00214E2837|nr:synaptotagmin-5-like [Schistocerca serialis cubense]XP_049942376.1 synaptotagmin-5-like [Schistocerca serialis cubense]
MPLGAGGRLLVLAAGASSVLLALLVVACLVGPGCCLYEYLHRKESRERRRQRLLQSCDLPIPGNVKLTAAKIIDNDLNDAPGSDTSDSVSSLPHIVRTSKDTGRADVSAVSSDISLLGRMQHRDSTYSSMSEGTERSSSFRSVSTITSKESNGSATDLNSPQIKLILQYLSAEDGGTGKLTICIKEVQRLPPRDYIGGLEPYVVMVIVRSGWPLHRRAGPPLHTFRTRTLRHSFNPHFDQTFTVEAKKSEVKEWCLRATAYDQDRFGNPTELCSLDLALREVKGLTSSQEEKLLTFSLAPSSKELGQILFGLSFLPTAQRLSFCILKAANLKYLEVTESLGSFYPFVRVIQLNMSTGRSLRRKKTTFRHASENPEFNETLTFDVAPSQLESATFLVLVCTRCPDRGAGGEEKSRAGHGPKDRCLGKLALGRAVTTKKSRDHWLAMLASPRTVISLWHTLK